MTNKYLIIGAGFVGLGIAQALKEANLEYEQVDASDDIGGNWHHGVYETAHIISSKKVTQFTHFPMPKDYPNFPSAKQIKAYLDSFTDYFQLRQNIQLNTKVTQVLPIENNLWQVTFDDHKKVIYQGIIICNGHHWCKKFPQFQGQFNGEIIHSKDYQHPQQLSGKRVLVIGGGNSACDIAAEAGRVAQKSVLSLRESVWFLPKSFAGLPLTDLIQGWMPEWLQRFIGYGIIRVTFGNHENYGMSSPTYRLFDKHPTLNNEVPYYIQHGRIIPKPAVEKLDGDWVEFKDGTRDKFDLIVCATGYHLSFPFLPPQLQRINGAIVNCYAGSFLDDYQGIYFIGWGQARGGVGSLISAYGSIFAQCLKLQAEIKIPLGLVFKSLGQKLPTTHLSDPHRIFKQLKLLKLLFPLLKIKAHQLDAQYSQFPNTIITKI
jgi:hypothetical protein